MRVLTKYKRCKWKKHVAFVGGHMLVDRNIMKQGGDNKKIYGWFERSIDRWEESARVIMEINGKYRNWVK